MRSRNLFTAVGLFGLIGCIEPRPDSTGATLVLEPAELSITVVDGTPFVQPFRATLLDETGESHDVTAETTFALADVGFGSWSDATLVVTGGELGKTRVLAAYGAAHGESELTVRAREHRIVGALPDGVTALFASAVVDPSFQPTIAYPSAGVVLPRNLGTLDVTWHDARDDLFELSLATTYLDVRVYARRESDASVSVQLAAADWYRLAEQSEPIELRVSGIAESAPKLAFASAPQRLYVTEHPLAGAVFWSSDEGIARHDFAPGAASAMVLPREMFEATFTPLVGPVPSNCYSCTLSPDGTRFAVGSQHSSAMYSLVGDTLYAPTHDGAPQGWMFASFNPSGTRLVTSTLGKLSLISDAGRLLAEIPTTDGADAYEPQVSPDGRWLVNVEATGYSAGAGTTLVVRSFDEATSSFGVPHAIVPLAPGVSNTYPAWSPDGQWIAFTRVTGWGTLAAEASIWIVKSDGSQPPIQLTGATGNLDANARFVPTPTTAAGERMYYVAFESSVGAYDTGHLQLWLAPFFPDRGESGPAFRLPVQPPHTDNHLLQWSAID